MDSNCKKWINITFTIVLVLYGGIIPTTTASTPSSPTGTPTPPATLVTNEPQPLPTPPSESPTITPLPIANTPTITASTTPDQSDSDKSETIDKTIIIGAVLGGVTVLVMTCTMIVAVCTKRRIGERSEKEDEDIPDDIEPIDYYTHEQVAQEIPTEVVTSDMTTSQLNLINSEEKKSPTFCDVEYAVVNKPKKNKNTNTSKIEDVVTVTDNDIYQSIDEVNEKL